MHNAPYIHPSHDSILELWQTFPNDREDGVATIISRARLWEFRTSKLEDDENAAEGMQYILEVLNTDYKDFQDILRLTQ